MTKPKKKKPLKRRGRRVKRVKRSCLSCDAIFQALSKFNRLCPTCKKRFAYYNVDEEATLRPAYAKTAFKE